MTGAPFSLTSRTCALARPGTPTTTTEAPRMTSLSVDSIARVWHAAERELVRVETPGISVPTWSELDEQRQDEIHDQVTDYLDNGETDEGRRGELFAAIVDVLADTEPDTPSLRLDERHPSISGVLRWFDRRPPRPLEGAQALVADLARVVALAWADLLPETAETTAALRKLLEAKDCAVRSSFDLTDDDEPAGDAVDELAAWRAAAGHPRRADR